MSHTKGKIEEVIECCNAITLLSKEDDSQVAQVMDEEGDDLTDTQKANAKELVRRWNAFEEDGLVSDLLDVCEKNKTMLNICARVFLGTGESPDPEELANTIVDNDAAIARAKKEG